MLSDMVPTGFHGVELADVQFGDTVLVIGIGPVGLMSVAGTALRGASRIIAVGTRKNCVEAAKLYGATDFVSYKDIDPDNIFAAVEFDDIKLIQRYMIYNRTGNKKKPFSLMMTTESKILAEGMMFNEVNYTGYRHIIRAQKHINEYIIEMNNIKVKKENKNVRKN